MEKKAILSKSAYNNMIDSVVEKRPKEPTGFWFGEKINENDLGIFSAYAVQTAKSTDTNVWYGNQEAIKRLRKLYSLRKELSNGKLYIGGFHSHTKENWPNGLSEDDFDFIKDEMKLLQQEDWVEMIIKIENKNYEKEMPIGEVRRPIKNNLQVRIYDEENHGYKLTFFGYHLDKNLKITPLKVRLNGLNIGKIIKDYQNNTKTKVYK